MAPTRGKYRRTRNVAVTIFRRERSREHERFVRKRFRMFVSASLGPYGSFRFAFIPIRFRRTNQTDKTSGVPNPDMRKTLLQHCGHGTYRTCELLQQRFARFARTRLKRSSDETGVVTADPRTSIRSVPYKGRPFAVTKSPACSLNGTRTQGIILCNYLL